MSQGWLRRSRIAMAALLEPSSERLASETSGGVRLGQWLRELDERRDVLCRRLQPHASLMPASRATTKSGIAARSAYRGPARRGSKPQWRAPADLYRTAVWRADEPRDVGAAGRARQVYWSGPTALRCIAGVATAEIESEIAGYIRRSALIATVLRSCGMLALTVKLSSACATSSNRQSL